MGTGPLNSAMSQYVPHDDTVVKSNSTIAYGDAQMRNFLLLDSTRVSRTSRYN